MGKPPAAYQILHLLPYPGWGVTYPGWGVPTLAVGTYSGQGVSTLAGGYLPWPGGTLSLARGYPISGQGGTPSLSEPGQGTPLPGCGQTDTCENSTFPYPSDAGGNKEVVSFSEIGRL